MKERFFMVLVASLLFFSAQAQNESIVQKGDIGFTVGASQYFGDLNPRAAIKKFKPAIGIFYRKQFTTYLGLRLSAHYTQLGFSDADSKISFQQARNLSFQTNLWEVALHGDFNFFKYIPGDPNYTFTPYITLGLGVFSFNPYTELNGSKIYLRDLGTEGQNIGYTDLSGKKRKPYKTTAVCMPFGVGLKYNVSSNMNLSFQIGQRLTLTDYLDDVSTTYVGADKFTSDPTANLLQDRSPEVTAIPIGVEGRQRGWSKQKDQYIIAEIGISFNIKGYRCPTNY
ncbi:porin family protein [Ferruginibacter lapsinanis]|uniref:type IX secretion system protein PorG n=1 Tax=Ferruginibacter lapsinanis TaxID=563172 RepID=UPI001E48F989|nr:DUF6089 family protein [Ferruginibacter lapsinanis]UEG50508.1 porin family protein [Ferruginibacter lapsinanis]